jgi:putative hydrolase of the HAD superfamily
MVCFNISAGPPGTASSLSDQTMAPRTDEESPASAAPQITTLIFDVDDTLYDVGTGFTAHRNGEGAQKFMVEKLGFSSLQEAKTIRDEYFARYHATAKGLLIAEKEGKLPSGVHFETADLADYWASKLNFDLLKTTAESLDRSGFVGDLKGCPLNLVAFSNGPRKYVLRVLKELKLLDIFGEDRVFAVEDVLPYCKPDAGAFQVVFNKVNVKGEECVMVEDSMKNIRKSRELGMKTVLITGKGRSKRNLGAADQSTTSAAADEAEATKPGDAPDEQDSAVDVAIESVEALRNVLPGLWETPSVFEPKQ